MLKMRQRSKNKTAPADQSGASFMEVLVGVAITSFGFLGALGFLALTTQLNQDAYIRTQASYATQALIESMHLNAAAVFENKYDGTHTSYRHPETDCLKQGCSPEDRAKYDRYRFDRSLNENLPNAKSSLKCSSSTELGNQSSVYSGSCRLEVSWSQLSLNKNGSSRYQSLVWVFQP
ncbi:type IV pilus modification protein PilV [Pseudolysobacter antarcticus]|uniref:Type IV pilus modification protein PilV n=1 Tax=Pseudolysobacter antarcticus TaxID=2511995 RepID=A0A411HK21_9GAMM|nr:type IV pilus modification protein PilV [Pseudolysobacter antarcticus]QBB70889.1 type IV pilus modification protein PilV [Pseudolysobacter antarcticus]